VTGVRSGQFTNPGPGTVALASKALALYRDIGDQWGMAGTLGILGDVATWYGDQAGATDFVAPCSEQDSVASDQF